MASKKSLIVALGVIAVIVVGLLVAIPLLARRFFYPKPPTLPQIVGTPTEQLLVQLQAVLDTNAPLVARSLQAGLSDSQISALETQGGIQLSKDLKLFYRWHNGMSSNSTCGLLPGQRFVPLDEMIQSRAYLHRDVASVTAVQAASYSVFAGYRKSWVQVLDDGAGDGYFYDSQREERGGSFFYHMSEVRYYLWFPSF
jgi:hypothetical protein